MELRIQLNKKRAYVIAILIVTIAATILVNAFGTNDPSVFGHSRGEVAGVGPIIAIEAGTEQTIQQAIDELASQGGGTVLMSPGTYTIAAAVNLTSNITLMGQGSGTILQATTNSIDVITETSSTYLTNVRLQDFAIRAGSATGVDGVVFTSVTGLIEGLDISGMQGVSISVTNPATSGPRVMVIRRNTINMTGGNDGIVISGGSDVMADSNLIATQNIINGTSSDGIDCSTNGVVSQNEVRAQTGIRGGSYCSIENNQVTSTSGPGITVSGCPLSVTGNTVLLADDEGIYCNGCGGIITSNSVRLWSQGTGTHAGIRTSVSGCAVSPTAIVGNNFIEAFSGGGEGINASGPNVISNNHILPQTGFFGIGLTSSGTGTITGNTIDDGGIYAASASELAVTGNTFIGTTSSDLNVTSASQLTVTGNYIRGDLDATSASTCALTGNVVQATLLIGGCSSSNNV